MDTLAYSDEFGNMISKTDRPSPPSADSERKRLNQEDSIIGKNTNLSLNKNGLPGFKFTGFLNE